VIVRGRDLAQASDRELTDYRRRRVGFVFQFYNLIPSLTAKENVELVTEISEDPLSPGDALDIVGLTPRAHPFPPQMSGGEQQRVAIARALAKRPDTPPCDEPPGALDIRTGNSVLAATGRLNLELGGPSVYPPLPDEVLQTASQPDNAWGEATPEEAARRSIYIHVKRSLLHPLLESLDLADTDSTCPVRFTTTQPTQALMMLNGEFMSEQARALAGRIAGDGTDRERRVAEALEVVLARPPREAEIARGVGLIEELEREEGFEPSAAFAAYSLLLLNLNEFAYLD